MLALLSAWLVVLPLFALSFQQIGHLRPTLDTSMVMHDVVPFIGLLNLPKITAATAPACVRLDTREYIAIASC
jgi:hypothetical protein